jgi:hypothetical protein
MAKARAIVKRRKAVRNIKKITKTMQMIATAKFQKSLKRAVGTKPYTQKVRELVRDLAASVSKVEQGAEGENGYLHPLLRRHADQGVRRHAVLRHLRARGGRRREGEGREGGEKAGDGRHRVPCVFRRVSGRGERPCGGAIFAPAARCAPRNALRRNARRAACRFVAAACRAGGRSLGGCR